MKFQKKNQTFEILLDENSDDPREHTDNLGVMVCFHKHYNLPNDTNYNSKEYEGWKELEEAIIKKEKPVIILPIYMLDHSGTTIKTTPFGCPWDSGQIGFIFTTKKRLKDYNVKEKDAKKRLNDEVELYDHYLTGAVYGFRIYELVECKTCHHKEEKELDSCWGFYGTDHQKSGLFEQAGVDIKEWKEVEE